MKLTIKPLDRLFSHYIRWIRDLGICQRCWTKYEPPTNALHCSHFWGRARKSVRFDQENCIAACYGCHQWLGSHPEEHRALFLKRLGQKRYDLLMLRANTPKKPDLELLRIWLEAEILKSENDSGKQVWGRTAR